MARSSAPRAAVALLPLLAAIIAVATRTSYAQIIDRRIPDDPVVHDAIGQIKAAVVRSRVAVDDASREFSEVAQRLSSSRPA